MFFSGDTAQCIASGVGFRFEDLKMLFKYERDRQLQGLAGGSLPSGLAVKIPEVNTLIINYRTHNGILSTAAGIVDLLEAFFPWSIDTLPREQGFFAGPKPMLLSETAVDDAAVMIVGADRKHSQIEFGAHQVLLVRTQAAKDKLPSFFDGCLAMTILEAKGLEFDDVFLWNFLTDSKAKQEWRLVLSYLIDMDETESARLESIMASESEKHIAGMFRPLEFNEQAHQILCTELKHLYTAITRARVRVVIYDEDPVNRAPLFYYLEKRGLCESVSVLGQSSSAQGMTVKTSVSEWRAQGNNLLQHKMFHLAAKCFSKSGDMCLQNEAAAQHLILHVAPTLQGKTAKLVELYLEAAECFMIAGNSHLFVAKCCYSAGAGAQKLGDRKQSQIFFDVAGKAYALCARRENSTDEILKRAIGCLRKAQNLGFAVDLLASKGRLHQALKLLRDEHRYDEALIFLETHQPHTSLDFPPQHDLSQQSLLRLAASVHAVSAQNPQRSEKSRDASYILFLEKVDRMTAEDEEHYLTQHGYKTKLVERLIKRKSYSKAGRLLSAEGKKSEAADVLCIINPNPGSKDFQLGIELLLAHALEEKCDEKERILSVEKAQHLQSRMSSVSSANTTGENAHGLEIFMACLESDPRKKETRLKRLIEAKVNTEFLLVRLLAEYELFCSRTKNKNDGNGKPPEWFMKDTERIIGGIDTITTMLGKDTNKEIEYLRCEQLFGLRRPLGSLCVSPARKLIMDWMLESAAEGSVQHKPVINSDSDFVIEPSIFKSALSQYLLRARKRLLVKAASRLNVWRAHMNPVPAPPAGGLFVAGMPLQMVADQSSTLFPIGVALLDLRGNSGCTGCGEKRGTHTLSCCSRDVGCNPILDLRGTHNCLGCGEKQGCHSISCKYGAAMQPEDDPMDTVEQRRDKMQCHLLLIWVLSEDKEAKGTGTKVEDGKGKHHASKTAAPRQQNTLFDACSDLEDLLVEAVVRLERIPRLDQVFPPSFQQKYYVQVALRQFAEESYESWKSTPIPKRSAKTLSKILVTLESAGYSKNCFDLLREVDQDFKKYYRSSDHFFTNLWQSKQVGAGNWKHNIQPNLQLATLRNMQYITMHLADAPVDAMRSCVHAIAISLLDLNRLHAQTMVDMVNLSSSSWTTLLPDSVARDLDKRHSSNSSSYGQDTLILTLEFLAAALDDERMRALPASTSAMLCHMVCAIPLNFVVSHAPNFPTPEVLRWSLVQKENWIRINTLVESILLALEYNAKNTIKCVYIDSGLNRSLFSPDPSDFFIPIKEKNPFVLVNASAAGFVQDQRTVTKLEIVTWFQAGLNLLKSQHVEALADSMVAGVNLDSLNANAEIFRPNHEEELKHVERLGEIAELEAQKDRRAGLEIVPYLQRALVQLEKQRAREQLANSAPQARVGFTQHLDWFQRLARYQVVEQVEPSSKFKSLSDFVYRWMWRGGAILFDERSLGGPHQYEAVKSRYI